VTRLNGKRTWVHGAAGLVLMALVAQAAEAYTDFSGTPHTSQVLTETSPGSGIYEFDEQYTWRDEGAGGHDQTELGTWASRTWEYEAYQYNGIGNVVDLSTAGYFVSYRFVIPVDITYLDTVTISSDYRQLVARATNDTSNWFAQASLFSSSSGSFVSGSNTVPLASFDTSTPGEVSFYFRVAEGLGGGAGIDSLHVTATTFPVPEPAGLALMGLAGCFMLGRRRA